MYDASDRMLRRLLATRLHREPRDIHAADDLRDDLHLNPLDVVVVLVSIELVLKVLFPYEDLDCVRTVGDLIEYVRSSGS